MAETDLHRRLVSQVACLLSCRLPGSTIVADLAEAPGTPVPPTIDGFRPDVCVRGPSGEIVALAEAKTGGLDFEHTYRQVGTFLRSLDKSPNSLFVLAVPGKVADHAKTLLRVLRTSNGARKVQVGVFDELDLWFLDPTDGRRWRLA